MRRCPKCMAQRLVRATAEYEAKVAGYTFEVAEPATRCQACGESYVSAADARRTALAIAAKLAELGEASGAAVRHMRKALGLKAVELAALLGLTPETVSRWETGAVPVDGFAFVVLGDLVEERVTGRAATTEARLRALREPAPRPRKVPLRLAG